MRLSGLEPLTSRFGGECSDPTELQALGMEERVGFEPTVPAVLPDTLVFETSAIDHSATSPKLHPAKPLQRPAGLDRRQRRCRIP